MNEASKHKLAIEENQRALLKQRQDEGKEWQPRFFHFMDPHWVLKCALYLLLFIYKYYYINRANTNRHDKEDDDSIKQFIFSKASDSVYQTFWLPTSEEVSNSWFL